MGIGITAIAYSLPKNKLTKQDLSERFSNEYIERILPTTGIIERRVASENECASDFAFNAAQKIFEKGVDPKSVDLLIMATQMPDYQMPTTACLLQTRLGIPTSAAAFDINLGCSQFVYALAVANAWVKAGMAKKALVLAGDTPTRTLNKMDNTVVPLFGDGGCACIVEEVKGAGFIGFDFGSDGRGAKDLIRPTSGFRVAKTEESAKEIQFPDGSIRSQNDLYMNGGNIFLFAIKSVPVSVKNALKAANLDFSDINHFIFHQASEMIVKSFAKLMKLPAEKVHFKLHDVGNIGGSTVAVTLTDAYLQGKIKKGDKILLSAFGVGLSWATAILEWDESFSIAVADADFSDSPKKPESQM